MKKPWGVLLLSTVFALGAVAQPSLQVLVNSELSEPYGVTVDTKNNLYVTDSVNNRIAKYISSAGSLTNLAGVIGETGSNDGPGVFAHFANPQGIVYARGGLVVADSGNHLIRFVTLDGTVSTLAGSTAGFKDAAGTAAQFNAPAGLAADSAGNIYIADLLNNRVRKLDAANNVTTVASGFSRPSAVAVDKTSNAIYVADTGTHSIRSIAPDGTVTLLAGSGSSFISGSKNALIATSATFNGPRGLAWVGGTTGLLVSDTDNHSVRRVYFNTNYNAFSVETFVSSGLQRPVGVAVDVVGNFPVVDLAAGQLLSIQVTKPQPPVSNPQIGIVVLSTNFFGDLVTELHPIVNSTFNNDVRVAILAEDGTETFYTLNPNAAFPDDPKNRITPARYVNGLLEWTNSIVNPSVDGSNVVVRAISTQDGRRPSDVITARFQFKVGSPNINGRNMGNFTMADETDRAEIWYTTDGSSPSNSAPSRQYLPGSHLNIVNGTNDVLFTARAFKRGYTPSSEVTKTFLFTELETSTIGVTRDFTAGIGSTIVVPIEVKTAPDEDLRSLQFRLDITPSSGAPSISTQLRYLMITSNDFVRLPLPTQDPPIVSVYQNGPTTGIAIAYIANLKLVLAGEGSLNSAGAAVVALVAVPIPPTAVEGQTYTLALVQPSGTSDAIQSPIPLSVFENRKITVKNTSYVVGDSAIGSWYNAGDFGNGNLNNNDVNNAFLASMGIFTPYSFSDVYDAMDVFPPDSTTTVGGDGQIRFLDWNRILARSLRLETPNWQRTWSTGGVRIPSNATLNAAPDMPGDKVLAPPPGAVWVRQANFTANGLENVHPGQTVSVPLYVNIEKGSTLSGLQFLAEVVPSANAPALTTQVLFSRANNLPSGTDVSGLPVNEAGYGWQLNSFVPALQGRVLLGNLVFVIPATAVAGQGYTIHFANGDGAPDDHTQYEFESFAGHIAVGGPAKGPEIISDEWKIHFFTTVDNLKADPNADPDQDGVPNWKEYLAGTDPTKADSRLNLHAPEQTLKNGKKQVSLHWLSAPGKKYAVERASDVAGSQWNTVVHDVLGDGNMKECVDADMAEATQYYRVRLQD